MDAEGRARHHRDELHILAPVIEIVEVLELPSDVSMRLFQLRLGHFSVDLGVIGAICQHDLVQGLLAIRHRLTLICEDLFD